SPNSSLKKSPIHRRSREPKPKTNDTGATATGCKPTGLMCYRKRVASFWRWRDRSRSSPIRRRRHGHGPQRHIQRITARLSSTYVLKRGRASMLIRGEWKMRDDGATRPVVRAKVLRNDGNLVAADFLI